MKIRVALLCLVPALVSACGGGGDGGSASNTPPPPPPPPFALTEANAVQAAAYALAPLEQMLPAGTLAMGAAAYMRAFGASQYVVQCGSTPPIPIIITYSDRDASNNVSVGDVIDVPAVDCPGLRRKVTLTLTQLGPTPFDQNAGRVEVDLTLDPPGMHVVGSFDLSVSLPQTIQQLTWRMANVAATVTQSNTTQTVRMASVQMISTPTTYALSITGGSVDSGHLGGAYAFATSTPLSGAVRRLPTSGELLLTASAGSRARVAPPATAGNVEEAVEYAVSPTTSGAFQTTQQTMWTAIVRGYLFGNWRPNVAPTLTNLQIQPANPGPGAALWVTYLAQDDNGDPLETTIEWSRNGTLVGTGSFLNATTARNDTISVTISVSDGRLSVAASTSITIGNPPPQLTLTLTPPQPDTTVDLVAVPDIFEPDGDAVTTTFEWRRNGTILAGQTAAVLPASATTRGDSFSVRVTASDGASTVEATASTTIVDSLPRVTVASPPTTVAHGAPVTFTATVSDADGDPVSQLPFVLAYGPAGMTIDPATGVVSWTAGGPMFDRTMNVNWGITTQAPAAQLATGTLQVTDSTRDYPLLRFGAQIPTWPAGLSIDDFDDDGDVEMLVMGQRWLFELEADGAGGYRQSWAYPYALNVDTQYATPASKFSVVTGDVDGDERHEVFVAAGRTITKLDGVERRPVASRQLAGTSAACADLLYGDLDNDGAAEVLCLSQPESWQQTTSILVLRASDLSVRYEFPQANYGTSFTLGNVDADSAIEIVTSGGYVFHGPTFVNEWFFGQGFGMDVDTGDLDGDGIEEIVAAAGWSAVRGYSATLKSPIWEVQQDDLDSLLVADIGGDARPEILVGDGQWGELTIYRYNTATNTADVVDHIDSQEHGVTSIGVADVDADGEIEVIWGSGWSSSGADAFVVAGFNPTLTVEWTNQDPLQYEALQLDGPFLGGGLAGSATASRAPLFLSSSTNSGYRGSRLVRMAVDGSVEISELLGSYYSANAVDVADYDNDGTDEAFLGHSYAYSDGFFRVYDFFGATSEWSSGVVQNSQAAVDVTHADLTGDGRAELVGISSDGVVYVHNVFGQTVVWQSTTLNQGRKVLVANVDGDAGGQQEIVAVTGTNVYVYRQNPPPIAYVQAAAYQASANRWIIDADVGDTDGDGDTEVVLLVGTSYYSGGNEIVTLNGNLQPQTVGSFTLPWEAQTLAIEPSGAPRKNLLVSRSVGALYYTYDGILAIVGARSGGIVYETPPLIGIIQRDSVNYVTLPGETQQRISVGTSAGMYLTR